MCRYLAKHIKCTLESIQIKKRNKWWAISLYLYPNLFYMDASHRVFNAHIKRKESRQKTCSPKETDLLVTSRFPFTGPPSGSPGPWLVAGSVAAPDVACRSHLRWFPVEAHDILCTFTGEYTRMGYSFFRIRNRTECVVVKLTNSEIRCVWISIRALRPWPQHCISLSSGPTYKTKKMMVPTSQGCHKGMHIHH